LNNKEFKESSKGPKILGKFLESTKIDHKKLLIKFFGEHEKYAERSDYKKLLYNLNIMKQNQVKLSD